MYILKINYNCLKCKRDIEGKISTDISRDMFNQEELDRAKRFLLSQHMHAEHTVCTRCKKKITLDEFARREWGIRIIGKENVKRDMPGDTGLRIYTGIFCKDCLKKVDEERSETK